MKRPCDAFSLVLLVSRLHRIHMRIALVLMLLGSAGCAFTPDKSFPQRSRTGLPAGVVGLADPARTGSEGDAFGVWKVNPIRSRDPYPTGLIVRFEPHPKGEAFTVDRISGDGRVATSSTLLYFDGKPRDFQDVRCSGTQSSRRVDRRTVEILRACASGERTRLIRRLVAQPKELILEIMEQQPDGRRMERRLVLEKQ
jgi:hypothetical protein